MPLKSLFIAIPQNPVRVILQALSSFLPQVLLRVQVAAGFSHAACVTEGTYLGVSLQRMPQE